MTRLPRITGKQMRKALLQKGFSFLHSRGSHFYFEPPGGGMIVTVPIHTGNILKAGTLKSILKQSGISVEELVELL